MMCWVFWLLCLPTSQTSRVDRAERETVGAFALRIHRFGNWCDMSCPLLDDRALSLTPCWHACVDVVARFSWLLSIPHSEEGSFFLICEVCLQKQRDTQKKKHQTKQWKQWTTTSAPVRCKPIFAKQTRNPRHVKVRATTRPKPKQKSIVFIIVLHARLCTFLFATSRGNEACALMRWLFLFCLVCVNFVCFYFGTTQRICGSKRGDNLAGLCLADCHESHEHSCVHDYGRARQVSQIASGFVDMSGVAASICDWFGISNFNLRVRLLLSAASFDCSFLIV